MDFAEFKSGQPAKAMFRKLGLCEYLEAANSWRSLRALIMELVVPQNSTRGFAPWTPEVKR